MAPDMRRNAGPFAGVANIGQCTSLSGPSGPPNTFIARPLNNGPNPAPIDVTFRTPGTHTIMVVATDLDAVPDAGSYSLTVRR